MLSQISRITSDENQRWLCRFLPPGLLRAR
jgi:hypothetical protein